MFHRPDIGRDASKVALVALVGWLRAAGPDGRLLDVQWLTPHLASLGVVEVPRRDYLARLDAALRLPARLAGPRRSRSLAIMGACPRCPRWSRWRGS